MDFRACLAATLLAAAALVVNAHPAGGRDPAALRSPGWALFAPAPLRAAPPPPLAPLSALANLYTIINGRAVAPASYLNAFHHNLLHLHFAKPLISAKVSAESPVKIFQPAPIPLNFQQLPRAGLAEPFSFPTNRPPPAATTELPATSPHPPISTLEPEPTSSEEVTTPGAPSTAPTESGTSPRPPPSPPPAEGKPTVLILKPFAKAVAGINGTAVATPVGHAVYHKGQPVDVVFDPRAVAVAGPGGNARAHSDLIVSYIEKE